MKHHDIQLTGSISITGSLTVPVGTTDERPANPKSGSLRMNTTTGVLEIYTAVSGAAWETVGEQAPTVSIASADIEYLLVAGGGGGSQDFAGGGGAGGMLSSSLEAVSSGSSFTVTIGGGGDRAFSSAGYNGDDSTIAGATITTITSIGGGGGAGSAGGGSAGSGGSGGGAGNGNGSGGSGTVGQGFAGHTAGSSQGAGGGGAGAAATTQNGATGKQSNITGTPTYYAGGGAGSTNAANQTGGTGGGGDYGTSGTANTGGGGGGYYGSWGLAGDGGSGVAIFAYDSGSINAAGGIVGDAGNGRKYHQFNSSGTFKVGSTSEHQIVTDNLTLHLDAGNYASRGTSTWTDLTGNQNGTVTGPSLGQNFYYTFSNASSDKISTGTIGAIGPYGTFEGWYYYNTTLGSNPRFWCTANSTSGADAYIDTGTGYLGLHGGNVLTSSTFTLNSWMHLTVTYTDGTITVYYNGVSQSLTGTTTGYNLTNTNTLNIGQFNTSGYGWLGYIGQFRMYSQPLSATQVLQNYNATKTNFV